MDVRKSSALNTFAIQLLQVLNSSKHESQQEKNLFMSPISISSLLLAVANGAKGETGNQLLKALNQEEATSSANAAFGSLHSLNQAIKDICDAKESRLTFHLSNRVLITNKTNSPIAPRYQYEVQSHLNTIVEQVDFARNSSDIIKSVNQWVTEQTRGLIRGFLSGSLDPSTTMLLLNAIYFKCAWQKPFDYYKNTRISFFNCGDAQRKVYVECMVHFNTHLPLCEATLNCTPVRILEIPYITHMSMFIILPNDNKGLFMLSHDKNTSAGFNYKELQSILRTRKSVEIDLSLPKFQIEDGHNLNASLNKLGITAAFDQRLADFGLMQQECQQNPIPTRSLFINNVLHKAFIEVNEEGTEAAAATSMDVVEGPMRRNKCQTFKCDHPFMFLIRENTTGLILFIGEVLSFEDVRKSKARPT